MFVVNGIEHLAILPVFRIPASLFPVDDASNLQRPPGTRNDDVRECEIAMGKIYFTSIGKEISIMVSLESLRARFLARRCSPYPVIECLNAEERAFFVVELEEPVLDVSSIDGS